MLSIALLVLAGAIGLTGFGLANWRERAATPELEERLQRFGSIEQLPTDFPTSIRSPGPVAKAMDRAVEGSTFGAGVAALLARANFRMTVGEFVVLRIGSAAGTALIGFVLGRGLSNPDHRHPGGTVHGCHRLDAAAFLHGASSEEANHAIL